MRAPALLALSGLTLAVAACNTTNQPMGLSAASSAAPAPVAHYDWFLHQDGQEARLAYGLEESDDLRIGLDCRKNSGRLALSAVAPEGAAHEIHLESGGDTERYPAEAEPSELNDGLFLTAEAKAGDPVFQRFRRVGWLAVWQGEDRHAYAPHPGSSDRVERFFAFCG
ncbi:hypothetical protein [Brevundimonas sp. M20]|jgi:hypothetical protein|uniref:hypothetical protein n=1 Tax=Brevundimonas sp. M20 TaxID=2591463 RepID=UPI0011472833|nr:hypothetical protein [Brevundimonas sp. M20]QDH73975.1 hypothetical protein FKQ52_11420 [Brevundimonas sp. M20]